MRAAIFWGVCIPLRVHLARLALTGKRAWLRLFALVIGARWLAGLENGDEGVFGGPAWWADERRAHGALWLAYAGTARGEFLATDVTFGAVNWFRNSIAPPKAERAPSLTLRAARRTDYPSPSSGV